MLRILNLKLIFHNSGFYELVFLLDVDFVYHEKKSICSKVHFSMVKQVYFI